MIPKRLHFIFGLTPDFGGKPFSFAHWAAIRSAQIANPGWSTTLWCKYEPDNRYFDAIRPHIGIEYIEPPDSVFGNPIPHPAHKCDWLRLQVLKQFGGVYLDLDTITVKGFHELLRYQTRPLMIEEHAHGRKIGLCNAFIASWPNSTFIDQWIEKFRGFRSTGHDQYWNESAVKWPQQIFDEHATAWTGHAQTFMQPDWTPPGIKAMFAESHEFPHAFGHHLWESFSWPYLQQITPETYRSIPCTYTKLLKRHLETEITEAFGV
jgi:hypothetical protein